VKSVPDMTYNVFSGTLHPTQSINLTVTGEWENRCFRAIDNNYHISQSLAAGQVWSGVDSGGNKYPARRLRKMAVINHHRQGLSSAHIRPPSAP